MELSLKEARRLEQEIQQYFDNTLGGFTVSSVKVSAYDNYEDVVTNAISNMYESATELDRAIELRYKIRDMIAQSNVESGITGLMARESSLRKIIQIHERFMVDEPLTDAKSETVQKRLTSWVESDRQTPLTPENRYGSGGLSPDELRVATIVDEETNDAATAEVKRLRKNIQQIADEMAALNINTKIVLGADDVEYLEQLGIL